MYQDTDKPNCITHATNRSHCQDEILSKKIYGNSSNGECQGTWRSPRYAPTFIPRGKGFDLPRLISDTFLYIGKGTLVATPNDGSGQSYFPTTTLGKY